MYGRRISCFAVVGVCLLAACGNDEGGDDKGASATDDKLDRPVYPRCGTDGFAKPTVQELESPGVDGHVWSVRYTRRGSANQAPQPGQTTSLLVVESPPATALPKNPGLLKEQVIADRRVLFASPTPKSRVFAAQWKTKRAFYSLLANGKQETTVKRFIACLP
jgi:hypothetical protein